MELFLVIGLAGLAVLTAGLLLGVVAFLRTDRYRQALIEADARIRTLEAMLGHRGHEAPIHPAPAPMPAPQAELVPAAFAAPELREARPPSAPEPPAQPRLPHVPAPAFRVDDSEPAAPPHDPVSAAQLASWMGAASIWVAGAAIALGIVLFLRYAAAQNHFAAAAQLIAGYAIAGGLLAGSEMLRRQRAHVDATTIADFQYRYGPLILACAGIFCFFMVSLVGLKVLHLLRPFVAFGLMGSAALIGIGLSLVHWRWIAWLGAVLGFAAPFLVGVGEVESAPALLSYIFAIATAALGVAKLRQWRALSAFVLGASLLWAVFWTLRLYLPDGVPFVAGYLVALGVLSAALTWETEADPDETAPATQDIVLSGAALAACGGVLLLLCLRAGDLGAAASIGLVLLVASAAGSGAIRSGFGPSALVLAALSLASLYFAPLSEPGDMRAFATIAGGLALVSSVGGWAMMTGKTRPIYGALLAAFAPALTLLIAHERLAAGLPPVAWCAMALAVAALNFVALAHVVGQAGGAQNAAGRAGAFAIAGAMCGGLASFFALNGVLLAAGLALLMVPAAWLTRRFALGPMRWGVIGLAVLGVVLLSPPVLMRLPIATTPGLNELAPVFLVVLLSIWAAHWLLGRDERDYEAPPSVCLRICFVLLILFGIWAEIRHLANNGVLAADFTALWELGAHQIMWLLLAILLGWRFVASDQKLLLRTELCLLGAAITLAAAGGLVWLAPWWGQKPATASGPLLAIAYLAPALLFALYAWVKRDRNAFVAAPMATIAAGALAIAWAALTIRFAFHGAAMVAAPIQTPEHFAYTAVALVTGGVLLALGEALQRDAFRWASAGFFAIALAKGFHDVGLLSGFLRYAGYVLVSAAAAGVFLLYQRKVFQHLGRTRVLAQAGDPNLFPPTP